MFERRSTFCPPLQGNVKPMKRTVHVMQNTDVGVFTICDSNGDSFDVKCEGGKLLPIEMKNTKSAHELSARHDDVFLCAYPRSGTHWVWELIMMVINNRLHLQKAPKVDAMLESVDCDHLEAKPSPRVINTHLNYDQIPPDVFRKHSKIVLLCRNAKDVAVSYYNFINSMKSYAYNGKFSGFFDLFIEGKLPYGSWFEYMKDWDTAMNTGDIPCPVYVLYYENLKQDFIPTMSSLCTFLGVSRPVEFLQEMEKLSAMDSFKQSFKSRLTSSGEADAADMPQLLRKGVVGDWKNWFTVAQNEQFDEVFGKQMKDSRFRSFFG